MKIRNKLTVREIAGEHIVVMPGRYGANMTHVLALNTSSLYLWTALKGREFTHDDVVDLLMAQYNVDIATARMDADAWIARLVQCDALEEK